MEMALTWIITLKKAGEIKKGKDISIFPPIRPSHLIPHHHHTHPLLVVLTLSVIL